MQLRATVVMSAVIALCVQHEARAEPFAIPRPPKGLKPVWEPKTAHNQFGVCLTASKLYAIPSTFIKLTRGRPQTVIARGAQLYAVFEGACESRCARRAKATCTVTRREQDVVLDVDTRWEARSRDNGCYDANRTCTPVICALPRLEDGDYTLRYGDDYLTFAVPGTLPPNGSCLFQSTHHAGEAVLE